MRHGRHQAISSWNKGRRTEVFGGRSGEEVTDIDRTQHGEVLQCEVPCF